MHVRYYIENNSITGLTTLLTRRQEILASVLEKKTESGWVSPIGDGHPRKSDTRPLADRAEDAWRDEVARFWIGHPILSKFTKKELSFNLGSPTTVQIVTERPELMMSGPRVNPDFRVDVHHNDVRHDSSFCVRMIEFEHIEFERLPGEADPRGTYSDTDYSTYGVVGLQNGKYRLTVQQNCQLDDGSWNAPERVLEEMTEFALHIVRGELKPVDYMTESG